MRFLYKLERKLGRFAIHNLMLFIVIGQAVVFLINYFSLAPGAVALFTLNSSLVLKGQVWRLLTFIFVPASFDIWGIIFSLYFYYFIGSTLEKVWGSFKFGVFYFMNVLAAIAAAFITGGNGENLFINLSLLVAFAVVSPDFEFFLFFLLRIKAKWFALVNAAFVLYYFIIGNWPTRAAILGSVVVLVLFFWHDVWNLLRNATRYRKTRNNFRTQTREWEREFDQNQRRARRSKEDDE